MGAIWAILSSYAPHDRLRYLPCLVDHLAFLILAPYVGPTFGRRGNRSRQLPAQATQVS